MESDSCNNAPERRKMMQTWADYLDQLKAGEEPEVRFRW